MIKIKKGLDLPITGEAKQVIEQGAKVRSVALCGYDYVGMKPTMLVKVGDKVKKGQALFADKKTEGVVFTAPAAGTVAAINRGAKRVFQSLVIDVEGDEQETFAKYSAAELAKLDADKVVENLVNSGLWTSLRTRPFSRVPAPTTRPKSIFVNAMDSNPLAANPEVIIAEQSEAFKAGVSVLSRIAKVFVCKEQGAKVEANDAQVEEFAGVHPAGLTGTHIHFLDPVSESKTVWSLNYQDAIAIGQLFLTGEINSERVVALAGPVVTKPRLVRTVVGANLQELTAGELEAGENRVISGSVFAGRTAQGAVAYLGRYHLQVSCLQEGRERFLFRYLTPGSDRHSVLNVFISKMFGKKLDLTTTTNGSERADE